MIKKAAVKILHSIGESAGRATELQNYFSTIVCYPLRNFLQVLCTINFFINGEKKDVSQLLLGSEPLPTLNQMPQTQEYIPNRTHTTLELENMLLSSVEHGKTEDIRRLFQQPPEGRAGIMAGQQKNLILCTATLVSRAAIKGGLDVETAFSLSDMYIQKAEIMSCYDDLVKLNAQMVLDFTTRVEHEKCGIHQSKLVRSAREYVLAHIGELITTEALAKAVGMNRTYLCKLFAEETGLTVNQYVTQVKMEEAKRLMDITEKSIGEIADYLGYSSQSHFQRVFKKQCAVTPGAYRADPTRKA